MDNNIYDESSIKKFDTNTGIRKKLGMYLNERNQAGSFLAVTEIYLNTLDEFGKTGNVTLKMEYDSINKIYKNLDDARGIPLGSMEIIMEELHSGGKLDNTREDSAYDDSGGQNGCGLCVCKSVSDYFIIESHRDGKSKRLEYKDGYRTNCIERELTPNDFPHGTYIEMKLSEEVLGDTAFDPQLLYNACETMAYNSPGFHIDLTIDGKKTHFYSNNGLIDLFNLYIKRKNIKLVGDVFQINFSTDGYIAESSNLKPLIATGEVLIGFNQRMTDSIISFVNRINTVQHGTHVIGLKTGITMAINKYIKDNEKMPKKYEKMEISGSILNDFLVSVISIRMKTIPFFSSQVKSKLESEEVTGWVKSKIYNLFLNWLNANPKEADKLVNLILKEGEARWVAKQAKNKALGIDKKENYLSTAISKRLEDCLSKNPEECEVFIVEGESASVGSVRNSKNQAYYLLRGKVPNVISINKIENDILLDFINMLGVGFGDKKNISKLRYHKIILLADADEDGQHITALLLGFFYKYYPELIQNGHVYIGNPPLYAITVKRNKGKDEKLFIQNINHYNYVLVQAMLNKFDAYSKIANKLVPKEVFEAILYGLIDYENIINNLASQQNITPNLLEYIVLYYKDIQKNNFKRFNEVGYKVSIKESDEKHKILTFDEDIHHYNVNFTKKFYENIYIPVFTKIAKDIKLINLYLKDVDSGKIISGTLYDYSKMMNRIFEGKISPKIKGLGEMESSFLKQSVIDPETRSITRVTMEDASKANKIIEVFLGKNYLDEKKAHFEKSMSERMKD